MVVSEAGCLECGAWMMTTRLCCKSTVVRGLVDCIDYDTVSTFFHDRPEKIQLVHGATREAAAA